MSVCAVVGGQFGSEGKGLIVGRIAEEYDHHVRVGAANAGHTLYTQTGIDDDTAMHSRPPFWEKHVMQQLPCAVYANPEATLYLGPGALITPEIYGREIETANRWHRDRGTFGSPNLRVDRRAHVIQDHQIDREAGSGLDERIGSTSTIAREGIGTATADRVMRDVDCVTAAGHMGHAECLTDVPMELADVDGILLEGTQGAGLSLTTGEFPYVTSRNTTSAGLAADCGVAPNRLDRIILVCRTYPIRVAGNSGPFALGSLEIGWADLDIDPESERTTVTKKVRRVATFSTAQVIEAAALNGATEIALTFCDYLDRRIAGSDSTRSGEWTSLDAYPYVRELVHEIQDATGVPVTMLGTGPHSVVNLRIDR